MPRQACKRYTYRARWAQMLKDEKEADERQLAEAEGDNLVPCSGVSEDSPAKHEDVHQQPNDVSMTDAPPQVDANETSTFEGPTSSPAEQEQPDTGLAQEDLTVPVPAKLEDIPQELSAKTSTIKDLPDAKANHTSPFGEPSSSSTKEAPEEQDNSSSKPAEECLTVPAPVEPKDIDIDQQPVEISTTGDALQAQSNHISLFGGPTSASTEHEDIDQQPVEISTSDDAPRAQANHTSLFGGPSSAPIEQAQTKQDDSSSKRAPGIAQANGTDHLRPSVPATPSATASGSKKKRKNRKKSKKKTQASKAVLPLPDPPPRVIHARASTFERLPFELIRKIAEYALEMDHRIGLDLLFRATDLHHAKWEAHQLWVANGSKGPVPRPGEHRVALAHAAPTMRDALIAHYQTNTFEFSMYDFANKPGTYEHWPYRLRRPHPPERYDLELPLQYIRKLVVNHMKLGWRHGNWHSAWRFVREFTKIDELTLDLRSGEIRSWSDPTNGPLYAEEAPQDLVQALKDKGLSFGKLFVAHASLDQLVNGYYNFGVSEILQLDPPPEPEMQGPPGSYA